MHAIEPDSVPGLLFIRRDAAGIPWLAGSRCTACAAVLIGERANCPACGGRGTPHPVRLAERGKLYNYTIVHRSFPGVVTPFVSAIVDLAGGGSLRGTLLDVDPAQGLPDDMPVDVVFRDTAQRDKDGRAFFAYYFVPTAGGRA